MPRCRYIFAVLILALLSPLSSSAQPFTIRGRVLWDINRDGDVSHEQLAEPLTDDDVFSSAITGGTYTVFEDANNNGVLDSGEEAAVVNATGHYSLTNVAGSVRVALEGPSGITITHPTSGYHVLSVSSNTNNINFGFTFDITVSGYVWDDLTYDGVNNPEEPPLANWTIFNDKNENRMLDSGEEFYTTDSTGLYSFIVPAGKVIISSAPQPNMLVTYPPPPLLRYEALRWLDWSNLDFGVGDLLSVDIYGYVYADWAGDGIFNNVSLPDYGLPNITIWNDENRNGRIDVNEAFGITDEMGNFTFAAPTVNNTGLIFRVEYSVRLEVPDPDPRPDYRPILPADPPVYNFIGPPWPFPLVFSLQPYTIIRVESNWTLLRDNGNGVVDSGDTLFYTIDVINTRFLAARLVEIVVHPDFRLLRVLRDTIQASGGDNLTIDYDYDTDDTLISIYIERLEPGEVITLTYEAEVRVFSYGYSTQISGWVNVTGEHFAPVRYRIPVVVNSGLCLTTYPIYPSVRSEEHEGNGDEDVSFIERIPGSGPEYPASARELLRLVQNLRFDQHKNSKPLSVVLRRRACLGFTPLEDANEEFYLVLRRLFYFGSLPHESYSCPQPSTTIHPPFIELFGTSRSRGYQQQVQNALRQANFNMSGYAIHYLPTYMDFYLLFIHLEEADPCPTPTLYVPNPAPDQPIPYTQYQIPPYARP